MATRPHRTPEKVRLLMLGLDKRGLLKPLASLCKEYHVLVDDVLAGKRNPRVVHARDACICHVLKVPMSTVEAGELFGMDHTSVISARQRYKKRDNGRLLT
jgi:chromosomal replication initiation ATPase DnaA